MVASRDHRTEFKPGYRGNDIEPGLPLDTHRLKCKRIVEPAYETICSGTNAYGRCAGNADVPARKRTRAQMGSPRQYNPTERDVIGKADLRSEASHGPLIVLGRSTAGG